METLQPKLRFPEFKGNWEKKNLGEIFTIFNGFAFSSSDSVDDGVLWVKIADVGLQEMKKDNLSFLPSEYLHKHKKFVLNKDDYVIALTRPILNGKLKIAKIDKFFSGSLLNQRVGKLLTLNNSTFVFNILQKDLLIKSIENNISGSDPPNLSPNEISFIESYIPQLEEQTRIANFLSAIDEKIHLLKEKKALLEEYKKGMMQKIFNQQIRFKDDNGEDFGDWEEKRFHQIYSFKSTNSFSRDKLNYEKGLVKNIHYGDIHSKFNSLFNIKNEKVPFINDNLNIDKISNESFLKENDLVIADASEDYEDIGKCIEIINLNDERVLAGLHTFIARPDKYKMASGFGNYLMKSDGVKIQIKTIAQGTKVLSISTTRLSEITVNIPSIKEQTKIAQFLAAIDEKIGLVGSQIEETVAYKKGLLQGMFV